MSTSLENSLSLDVIIILTDLGVNSGPQRIRENRFDKLNSFFMLLKVQICSDYYKG